MARPKPLSGFPEFLPAQRIVEQRVTDIVRSTFELHGFASIETRAVESMDSLTRKGEITKEVYVVRRLHAVENEHGDDLGLHFDLTVPLARYVLENSARLAFPFRRHQIQKVWRGERPQEGRYREFPQADIDIIGENTLAAHHDVEAPLVMLDALEAVHTELGLPPARMHVNNRKLSEGFYRGLGITDTAEVLQRVDKFDKIGPTAVAELLTSELGLSDEVAGKCVELATICTPDDSFVAAVRKLGVHSEMLDEGLDELAEVLNEARRQVPGRMVADLKIARGLDYYTGTVYESFMAGHEDLGSVCSGGRYDSLATNGKRTFPGVGISIGLSRLLARVVGEGLVEVSRPVPTVVLVAVTDEAHRSASDAIADALRARGISADVAPSAAKFGKQIKAADKRSIPFVWFPGADGGPDSVKDIRSGEQVEADAATWQPPSDDDVPQITVARAAAGTGADVEADSAS